MIFSLENKQSDTMALYEDSGLTFTYGQLCGQLNDFGAAINNRSLVFCLCKNTIGSLIGYLGCLNSKNVALLLDANMENPVLSSFYNRYQPSFFWMPLEKKETMQEFVKETIFSVSGYGLFATGNPTYPMHEKLGLLLATSGSTGSPKLVRLSLKNLEVNAASIAEYLKLSTKERPITTLPMQYTYGLSIINSHLLTGGCILMTEKSIVQQEFWDFLSEMKATSFGGVPYTYEILKKMNIFERDISSLTSITQAGGKLPETLQKEFGQWARQQGIRFYIMYGQTEATARMSYLPAGMCLEKIGSIGIAVPGGRFLLRDADGSMIEETKKTGELIYMGENVALGYAQCPYDLEKGDECFGILETGDMAWKDADGYFYIAGRKKRFIKIFGIRVGLDECEQLLRNQFEGAEFACLGEDDALRIYTTDESAAEKASEWLAEILHLNKKAFSCLYIEMIPKNNAGKILYSALNQQKR